MVVTEINFCIIISALYVFYSANDFYHRVMNYMPKEELKDAIINERFVIGEEIGSGYSGFVCSGVDLLTNNEVAIKFAWGNETTKPLHEEYEMYLSLNADNPEIIENGIPHMKYYTYFEGYKVIVMTKLGPTLMELLKKTPNKKFTKKTVLKIALQAMDIFEYIHAQDLVYHDVKPANMAIGCTEETADKIFFIDFSFTKPYVDELGNWLSRRETVDHFGTPAYMAPKALQGFTQAPKDDLIAFGLVLLEFNGVVLPWLDPVTKIDGFIEKMEFVSNEWDRTDFNELYAQSDCPDIFRAYFEYIFSMNYKEFPDYDALRRIFSRGLSKNELNDKKLF